MNNSRWRRRAVFVTASLVVLPGSIAIAAPVGVFLGDRKVASPSVGPGTDVFTRQVIATMRAASSAKRTASDTSADTQTDVTRQMTGVIDCLNGPSGAAAEPPPPRPPICTKANADTRYQVQLDGQELPFWYLRNRILSEWQAAQIEALSSHRVAPGILLPLSGKILEAGTAAAIRDLLLVREAQRLEISPSESLLDADAEQQIKTYESAIQRGASPPPLPDGKSPREYFTSNEFRNLSRIGYSRQLMRERIVAAAGSDPARQAEMMKQWVSAQFAQHVIVVNGVRVHELASGH